MVAVVVVAADLMGAVDLLAATAPGPVAGPVLAVVGRGPVDVRSAPVAPG